MTEIVMDEMKEISYSMMHSTHFVHSDIGHIIKGHLVIERENPLLPLYGLLFPISSKGFFNMFHPTMPLLFLHQL